MGMDIIEWCNKHNLDPAHAIVLRGVLKPNFDPELVKEIFKDVGAVAKFVDKEAATATTFQVLVEFSKQIVGLKLGDEVTVSDKEVWKIVKAPSAGVGSTPSFDDALKAFLQSHNKSLKDLPLDTPSTKQEIIVKLADVPSRPNVRRLRQFSGKSPVPGGELDYETWSQLAQQLLRDNNVSPADQKSAITQSLFPPALNLLCKLEDTATAQECLEVLENVYGTVVDADDLYTKFRETYQSEGENPSDFLFRLDNQLTKAIKSGGVDASQEDKLRLNQFIRGCIYDETLVTTLQLHQRKVNPPPYLELMREVRVEEANSQARAAKRSQTVKSKKVVSAQQTAATPTSNDAAFKSELETLRKELAQLRSASQPRPTPQPSLNANSRRPSNKKPKRTTVCYNCGEYGHTCFMCTNARNVELAQQRLAQNTPSQKSGNGQGPLRRDDRGPNVQQ